MILYNINIYKWKKEKVDMTQSKRKSNKNTPNTQILSSIVQKAVKAAITSKNKKFQVLGLLIPIIFNELLCLILMMKKTNRQILVREKSKFQKNKKISHLQHQLQNLI